MRFEAAMQLLESILIALGGTAALLGLLGYLGKKLLEGILDRDAKRFNAQLAAQADERKAQTEIAGKNLAHALQLTAMEHQVRFSKLHQNRADVIVKLYDLLVEMVWAAESFLNPMEWTGEKSKEEKHKEAWNALVEFYRYFEKNRIYFPPHICAALEKLTEGVKKHVIKFGVYVRLQNVDLNEHTQRQKDEAWDQGWEAIKQEVPLARAELEEEFRKILGSSVAQPSPGADAAAQPREASR